MLDFDRRLLVVAGLIVILAAFMGYKFGRHVEAEKAAVRESLATSQEEKQPVKNEDKKVFVYVVGAVQQPGVIQMTSGDRVFQAVDQARPVADADLQQLNLASPVNDGDKIYVPRMGEKT
ncbi:MAG: SLBB domain-containing protein, partial [Chitinophagales bacterium]